jgi:hypothetical protein
LDGVVGSNVFPLDVVTPERPGGPVTSFCLSQSVASAARDESATIDTCITNVLYETQGKTACSDERA